VLQKLVDVTELVQEEFRIEYGRRRNEHSFPERDRRSRARTQSPTGNSDWYSAATIRRFSKVGITKKQLSGELDSLSDQRPDES
jgi:hypothetical protein